MISVTKPSVRQLRWPAGVRCPHCSAAEISKQGRDNTQPARQNYRCEGCHRYFDDLTGTVLAGHHQLPQVWILCLYFMGLNLSNVQVAQELGLTTNDVQRMTEPLRAGERRRPAGTGPVGGRWNVMKSTRWRIIRGIRRR